MGILFSKCCKVKISFKCMLCNEQASSEPEEPVELRSAHNEEGGKLFVAIIAIAVGMKRGLLTSLQMLPVQLSSL